LFDPRGHGPWSDPQDRGEHRRGVGEHLAFVTAARLSGRGLFADVLGVAVHRDGLPGGHRVDDPLGGRHHAFDLVRGQGHQGVFGERGERSGERERVGVLHARHGRLTHTLEHTSILLL
jgi:hypothetical protein